MTTIAVIDYDMGNLHSACKGLEKAGATTIITADPDQITQADGVVLPGVGAFDPAMQNIRAAHLEDPIKAAIASGKPFLGICVGMQILFDGSEEGTETGLGIIPGIVKRFRPELGITIPHMGWNQLEISQPQSHLWQDLPTHPWLYFVHSFYAIPTDQSLVAAYTKHGTQMATAAIAQGNLMAVHFHPEKSAESVIKILANFVNLVRNGS